MTDFLAQVTELGRAVFVLGGGTGHPTVGLGRVIRNHVRIGATVFVGTGIRRKRLGLFARRRTMVELTHRPPQREKHGHHHDHADHGPGPGGVPQRRVGRGHFCARHKGVQWTDSAITINPFQRTF